MQCPNCGKEVKEEGAVFCPYCSKSLKIGFKRTPLPIVAGILSILTACLVLTIGVIGLIEALSSYGTGYGYGYIAGVNVLLWIISLFAIVAFPVGLTGGIFSLRRRYIAAPILGSILLLTSGVLLLVLNSTGALPQMFLWIYGIGAMILSILSIIFAALAKSEFT